MGKGNRKVLVLVGAVALAAMSMAGVTGGALAADSGSGKVDPAKLPKSLHGAVETKAFTFGTVLPPIVPAVGSVLLDPGPAYAYSTLDRDDYGDGNVNFTMTARGANVDPGTIAAAAMWAAPNCDDPNAQLPCALRNPMDPITDPKRESGPSKQGDVDLHTAAGFPAYAEALYPDQPGAPSRQRTYKCIVNKDANGAQPTQGQAQTICHQGGDSVPLTAWAEAVGDDIRSEGFSRAEGFAAPGMFSVGPSESHSLVQPQSDGSLHSTAYSTINSIDIGGGQIKIDQVRSEGDLVSTTDKVVSSKGSCTMSGLTIGGQRVQNTTGGEIDPSSLKPLLDGVEAATKFKVEIVPPKPAESTTIEGSKHVVSCAGLHIAITDERTESLVPVCSPAAPPPPPPDSGIPPVPQCVPPAGVRYELSFGTLSVQEAVNAFAAGVPDATGGGGVPSAVLGNDVTANPSVPTDVPGTPDLGAPGAANSVAQTPFSPPRATRNYRTGTANVRNAAGFKLVGKNLAEVAALTGGSAAALGICVWFLLGVVDSVAKGTPLKLPGL